MTEIPFDPKVVLDSILQLHRDNQDTDIFDIYNTARGIVNRDAFIIQNVESVLVRTEE